MSEGDQAMNIAEKLRTRGGRRDGFGLGLICDEAATEIERLNARIAELEKALEECEHQTHSLRVWAGGGYSYHPPQAGKIAQIACAALQKATNP